MDLSNIIISKNHTLTSLFEHLDEMVFVIKVEGENKYRCIEVNQSYLNGTGVQKDDIIDKTIEEIVTKPEADFVIGKYNEALSAKKTLVYEESATFNGKKQTYETTLVPIFSNGNSDLIIGISRNITKRKNFEEEILRLNQEFQNVIQNQQGIIFKVIKVDSEFYYTLFEGQLLNKLKFDSKQIIGKRPHEIMTPSVADKIIIRYEECWVKQEKMTFEETDPDNNNTWLTVLNPLVEEGVTNSLIGFSADITERKLAEKSILNREKLALLGELSAGIGHEIKNPLTSIKGFIKIMKENKGNMTEDYFKIIEGELESIERVTEELMMLARPQAHEKIEVNLNFLLKDVVSMLQFGSSNQRIKINLRSNNTHIYINGVKEQLRQMLYNVIENAIESMEHKEDGTIQIDCNKLENKILIQIVDEGCGISEDSLKTLGEPFYTTKTKGTGLGLMIARRIIKNHNGNMKIESELEKGTTILISLPVL